MATFIKVDNAVKYASMIIHEYRKMYGDFNKTDKNFSTGTNKLIVSTKKRWENNKYCFNRM